LVLAASATSVFAGDRPEISRGEFDAAAGFAGPEALRSWDVVNVGSGFWNVGSNWSPAAIPGTGDDVRLYQSDAANREVTYASASPLVINSLRTDAGGVGLMTMVQNGDRLTTAEFVQGVFNGKGRYELNGGTLITQAHYVGAIGTGTFDMTGGRLTNAQFVAIGNNAGATGTMRVSGGTFNGAELEVGYFGTGTMLHSGGTVNLSQNYGVGFTSTGVGTYRLSGTSNLIAPAGYVGLFGTGTFIQSGGSHTILSIPNATFSLGEAPGAVGHYAIGAGTLTTPEFSIGSDGTGRFVGNGGVVDAGNAMFGARTSAIGHGTLNGARVNVATEMAIANGTNSFATFRHDAGTLTVGGDLSIAFETGSVGTYTLNGGVVSSNKLKVGYIGDGHFVQTFGTQNVATYLSIADQAASNSTYDLRGGTLNTGELEVGYRGVGLMTQDGGTVNVASFTAVGFVLTGRGEYNLLAGGTLNSPNTYVGLYGTGIFTHSGGRHNLSGVLSVGENTASEGTYVLGEAGIVTADEVDVGFQGTGIANHNGGTLTTNTLLVGASVGGVGTYTLNSGRLNVGDAAVAFTNTSSGQFVQNGGTQVISGGLSVAVQSGTAGTYEVRSGSMSANTINIGGDDTTAGGSAVFTQEGGTINVAGRVRVYGGNQLNINGGSFSSGTLNTLGGGQVSIGGAAGIAPRVTGIQGVSGTIDITSNAMIVDYTGSSPLGGPNSFGTVAGLIANGWNNGNWAGLGIRSSLGTSGTFAVGYGEASNVFGISGAGTATFQGQTVDATSALVLFTLFGDADLSRRVDLNDFTRLAANFGFTGQLWTEGDFNYDGNVTLDDFTLLAANFGYNFVGARPGAVPEPAGLAMLVIAGGAILRRTRR